MDDSGALAVAEPAGALLRDVGERRYELELEGYRLALELAPGAAGRTQRLRVLPLGAAARETVGRLTATSGQKSTVSALFRGADPEQNQVLLGALLERVATIDFAGAPVWLSHNTLRTLERLPLRFTLN